MAKELKLPKGTILGADQGSAPFSHAERLSNDQYAFRAPEMLGIQTQIQHSRATGKPPTKELGMVGTGAVASDRGVMLMIQMNHPDGAGMAAIMSPEEFVSFVDCMMQAYEAGALAASGGEGKA